MHADRISIWFFDTGGFPWGRCVMATALVATLAGCTPAPKGGGINDPYEAQNRSAHKFNVAVDKALLRPTADVYGHVLPEPVRMGVNNFAANLGLPGDVLNDLLQGNLADGVQNTTRFTLNTIVGLGGLFDPASRLGIEAKNTDFGATLHTWGAPEGAYLEAPFLGPTTERDLAGTVVDLAANPLRLILSGPQTNAAELGQLPAWVGDRYRFKETVDSILYDSADSYVQERLLYLAKRHYDLGEAPAGNDSFTDPYGDPYAN